MTTTEKIKTEDKFAVAFEGLRGQLPGGAFVQELRQKAMNAFLKQGIPGRKNEEYKYSPAEKIIHENLSVELVPLATRLGLKESAEYKKDCAALIPGLNPNTIVLFNGSFRKELSQLDTLPDGVIVEDLFTAFENKESLVRKFFASSIAIESDPFAALNTALCSGGVFIYVPANCVVERPLHLIHTIVSTSSTLIQPRNLIVLEKGASLKLVESFDQGDSKSSVLNSVTEVFIDERAVMQYYKLQNNFDTGCQINLMQVKQQANSHFDTNTVTLNGKWIRNNLNIVVDAENCETHLNGLFISGESQHVDNHTLVDHQKPNCESNQLYKGILEDKSTGVFNGKIYVRKDAQKINAYQSSKNILLSDDATINTKPQLEIYANDVKCSHGSSTGRLDEEALFYLRSRGLGEESARRLLLNAFASDAINTIRIDALRNYVNELIEKRLTTDNSDSSKEDNI